MTASPLRLVPPLASSASEGPRVLPRRKSTALASLTANWVTSKSRPSISRRATSCIGYLRLVTADERDQLRDTDRPVNRLGLAGKLEVRNLDDPARGRGVDG